MVVRARQERPLLLLLTLVASLALLAGMAWPGVLAGWLLLILVVVARKPAVLPVEEPEVVEEEEPVFDPLPQVAATLGALDIPAFVLGQDASVLFQNKAAEKAFGALPTGSHLSAKLRSPGILDMVRETIATDEPNQIEHSERLPSERVYMLRVAPIDLGQRAPETPDDEVQKFYLLSFKDISELRRIDRMRSDFVANASHELRTPLASLRGFIETLQGPARSDPAAQERFLAIMFDQATRMSRLVDDLMSLSRLELKSHIAPDQTVDLRPLIGHVRDALLPLAEDLGVEIRTHLPEGKVEVLGDRDELVQVFENLIENACKYGQEGKFVDVYLKKGPSKPVEVSVVDQGPGIPAEHVPRLTERFYRVSVADSRSKKGTGLGLAIVKHILTRHRARLIVKSEVGKGSEFTVRF
ncbi:MULTISPECIES: phosphate regulon sensor histidine kinase PhoR [Rhizobium/Agrobacterium group]|uniref:histidine kinase n=1 Tax=Neorhizobium petrolearium TaxID=515361 RepID=A0ABY8M251_9HYPH|nr:MULTISPECIES: phosphate regulon sensor histidine kinase PhoR [Rhizobium/Agrobacterium group]KGD86402.1 histidine kinase [Rhizobium sp. YS-1r]MCC2608344.1 phosphate regulon sensor histidine kinase PhoR [Neorhizobium petrolearium]WGI68623.1 phosphate regulon sensor histidine kinase PhoR [Neorhizobium petrolearium]